jgi:hypothetical protein
MSKLVTVGGAELAVESVQSQPKEGHKRVSGQAQTYDYGIAGTPAKPFYFINLPSAPKPVSLIFREEYRFEYNHVSSDFEQFKVPLFYLQEILNIFNAPNNSDGLTFFIEYDPLTNEVAGSRFATHRLPPIP